MRAPLFVASALTVVAASIALPGSASVAHASPSAPAVAASHLVINEVYGGGGNSGATLENDFVELDNPTAAAISVSGYSVQYNAATGTSAFQTTALTGSVPAGHSYLVQEAAGASTSDAALPTPDATGTLNLSATTGRVALVSSATALPAGCGTACATAAGVVDFVGFGPTAASYEGSGPAPLASNTTSISRTGFADTNDNAADFTTGAPSPVNSAGQTTGGGTGTGGGGTTLTIDQIQGAAILSPYAGQAVTGVAGIVTAVSSTGFFLQDPNPDADPNTSEGIFVFTDAAGSAKVGDADTVAGTVAEFNPGGASDPDGLTVTEIDRPSVTTLSSGNALPAAVVVGSAGEMPPTETYDQPGDTAGNITAPGGGTFDRTKSGIDFWESLEGMRVEEDNALVVGPTNSFGETAIVPDRGVGSTGLDPRGGLVTSPTDVNPERVIVSDALGSTVPAANVGDDYTQVVGVLNFDVDEYMIDATQNVTRVDNDLQPTSAPAAGAGQLSLATFNVENLSPTDPATKFARLAGIVVSNLGSPDIIAVEEIQDDDGATDDGVVDASTTYADLIAAIKTAGGPSYSYTQIDPTNDADGGEPGGNIRQGLLYRTDRGLTLMPGTAGTATQAESVTAAGNLTLNPGRIDPMNSAWSASRKPLAAEFVDAGKPVFVIANHLVAKLGDDPLFGDDQPPKQSSETQRVAQATAINTFVRQLEAADSGGQLVVLGDLNDYSASQAVQELTTGTGLTDLITKLPADEQYTYDYEGNSEVLDHILVSPSLASDETYDVVHVNAEFADQASDHDPQVVTLFGATPPPALPETHLAALLPVSGIGVMVIALFVVGGMRRRTRRL
jgi:predicted extracellular nuclease